MVSTACLLFGCIEEDSSGEIRQPEPLFQEQWALAYDESFYEAYSINANAHIQAENALHNYTGRGVRIAIIDHGMKNLPKQSSQLLTLETKVMKLLVIQRDVSTVHM